MDNLLNKSRKNNLSLWTHNNLLAFSLAMLHPAFVLADEPATANAPSTFMQLVPFIFGITLIFGMQFYSQSKKMKEQQNTINNLKRGDKVLTQSGILGTIEGLSEQFLNLEIAPDVRIKILKNQVTPYQEAKK